MAINQKVLRLSRPSSNDLIKAFKLTKTKFLSPEVHPRDGISPNNAQHRKSSSSPHHHSNHSSGTSKSKLVQKSVLTNKTKTNSQLSKTG
jgi:hypothetical protein